MGACTTQCLSRSHHLEESQWELLVDALHSLQAMLKREPEAAMPHAVAHLEGILAHAESLRSQLARAALACIKARHPMPCNPHCAVLR